MPRVLIIDDSESIRHRVQNTLKEGGVCDEFLTATNGIEGIRFLLEHDVDLILCDVVMPHIDGFKFLNLKKSRRQFDDVPVIMLTGEDDVGAKVRGLEAGASDYLTKPFHEKELVARVRVHLQNKELRAHLRAKNEQLEWLARVDPLTGVANRRHFMESFELELNRAIRHNRPLGCVMLDIDHFKRVNDTHGHLVGDAILVRVARELKGALRGHDLVGRYGGEEFVLVLPEVDTHGAAAVAERCRMIIRESCHTMEDGTSLNVTVSLGITSRLLDTEPSVTELLRLADDALYRAKEAGRDQLQLANVTKGSSRNPKALTARVRKSNDPSERRKSSPATGARSSKAPVRRRTTKNPTKKKTSKNPSGKRSKAPASRRKANNSKPAAPG